MGATAAEPARSDRPPAPDVSRRRRSAARLAVFAALALLAEFSIARLVVIVATLYPSSDFAVYRAAALVGLRHGWPAMYNPGLIHAAVGAVAPGMTWQLYVNPPLVAWLALPLAALPYPAAYVVWCAAMATALAASFLILTPPGRSARWLAALVCLAFFPTVLAVISGQVTGLAVLGLALTWHLSRKGSDGWAGVALALAFALKPNILLLVPAAYLLAGRWRLLSGFLLAGLVLAAAAFVAIGTSGLVAWYMAEGLMQGQAINHIFTLTDIFAAEPARRLQIAAGLVAALAVWRRRGEISTPLIVGLVATVATAEHLNAHDLVVLLVAAALQAREQVRMGALLAAALTIAAGSAVIMVAWIPWNLPEAWLLPLELAWLVQLAVRPAPAAGTVAGWAPRRITDRLPLLAASPLLALMLATWIAKLAVPGDFALYAAWARVGLAHGWSQVYSPAHFAEAWTGLPLAIHFPNNDPPFLLWLVLPFAVLPGPAGAAAWQVVLLAATAWCWWVLSPAGWRIRALVVVAAFEYVGWGLGLGQVVPVVAAAVTACWWLDRKGHPYLAGLALAAVALKPQLAFLIPPALLLSGRFRILAAWLAATSVLAAAALVAVGPDGLLQMARNSQAGLARAQAFDVATTLMLSTWLGSGAALWVGRVLAAGLALAAAWRWRDRGLEVPLAAGLIGSLLCTPFIHPQDLALLLVGAALCLRAVPAPKQPLARRLIYAGIFLPLFPVAFPVVEVAWLAALALLPRPAWLAGLPLPRAWARPLGAAQATGGA